MLDRRVGLEHLGLADHLVDRAEAELRHVAAGFLGDHEQVIDDVFRLAVELRPQFRILRRNPDRARVQVTLPHHDATQRDQRSRREAELFGTQQRPDNDITAGLQPAVGLQHDAASQIIQHQHLMRLGDAQLPGQPRVFDRRQRAGTRSAGVAGDQDVVGVGLGDARSDHADADLRDQFDADPGGPVGVLQVVDQLRQILDRIDVVVRRRRDQSHARRRIPDPGDVLVDLLARQLAALAGLGPLRDLDLDLIGVGQILDRHAEPPGGDLLDRRPLAVAVFERLEPDRILAALARVRLAAQAVHRDGERLVRLGTDAAQ